MTSCVDNSIHCLYSNDANPPGSTTGNYIRITFQPSNISQIMCSAYGFGVSFDSSMMDDLPPEYAMGNNTWTIEVCSDKHCTQSQLVSTDAFVVSKDNQGNYHATPQNTPFYFAGYYPPITCSVRTVNM